MSSEPLQQYVTTLPQGPTDCSHAVRMCTSNIEAKSPPYSRAYRGYLGCPCLAGGQALDGKAVRTRNISAAYRRVKL